ncbi:1-phosphofructokinase [Streptococcus bovimastitidis]|uniref:Tagatose-6-phosphate kinase n=1 Tax=Streptococcus bovimastitidis TaxID=1856638 RepID=A0A1L8MKY3_9STRE|nr:1-phosphofructokinase [Streptococcus bovimastitidis]OJF71345.1 1-phosphofructokinase [Streptococcus bovimastitidis]
MITTVTLNASIDKAYYLEHQLSVGKVMRVKKVINSAGGKGLNVARIINLLGEKVIATGFVGGNNGNYLLELLNNDGITSSFTTVQSETRSCINVIEENFRSTEFLESGEKITDDEISQFLENFQHQIEGSEVVTISGSIPKGIKNEFYKDLIEMCNKMGKKVILDSSGISFQKGLLGKPTLVKPNKEELEAVFECDINSLTEVIKVGKKISDQGVPYVVVSLGKNGAIMIHDNRVYHARPPLVKAINTVGCGDSMVAGLAIGLEKNTDPKDCLIYAVAVGTANAMSTRTGYFDIREFEKILKNIEVTEIV